jgi:hypothetical protein
MLKVITCNVKTKNKKKNLKASLYIYKDWKQEKKNPALAKSPHFTVSLYKKLVLLF